MVVAVGGSRDHLVALAVDDRRYRSLDLEPGEVALYNNTGTRVVLRQGGVIEITAATKVRMVTPLLEVTGEIKDRCDTNGKTMSGMRSTYDSHTHPGDSGGTTGLPNQPM